MFNPRQPFDKPDATILAAAAAILERVSRDASHASFDAPSSVHHFGAKAQDLGRFAAACDFAREALAKVEVIAEVYVIRDAEEAAAEEPADEEPGDDAPSL